MAKGALYWRLKDERTGKWTYTKVFPKGVPDNLTDFLTVLRGRVVSNIFDKYLPKLIVKIETDEFVWEMWDYEK